MVHVQKPVAFWTKLMSISWVLAGVGSGLMGYQGTVRARSSWFTLGCLVMRRKRVKTCVFARIRDGVRPCWPGSCVRRTFGHVVLAVRDNSRSIRMSCK